jgi:predicted SprT family Zn-dependent metalloprotease
MAETKSKSKAKPKTQVKQKASSAPKTVSKPKEVEKSKSKVQANEAVTATTVTFKCRLCEKQKPISEMKIIKRFRPVIFVCQDCEKTLQ